MKIVTSFRVKDEKQAELKRTFTKAEFHFFPSIENAKEHIRNAEIVVTYGEDLTPELIKASQKLKWIMVMSAGLDQMPFQAIKEKGIIVTNAKGIHKIPMAEYTLGMMLQLTKKFNVLLEQEKQSLWSRKIKTSELHGKTILVIGIGAIGSQIAKLSKAFGMKVIGINRSGQSVENVDVVKKMEELKIVLPEADFVVSVLPSTNETTNILTLDHFKVMKDTAIFINIGRGNVVEEKVLLEAMQNHLIHHAVLDVFENEPLHPEHLFWKMNNITVTPHISSITANYLPRAFEIFEENLHTYIKNGTDYINLINVEKGY